MRTICRLLFPLLALGVALVGCDSGSTVPEDLGDNTAIAFSSAEATVSEGVGSFTVEIEAQDPGFKQLVVEVSVLASQGTADADDYRLPDSLTVTFPKSTASGDTESFTLEIVDDEEFLEGDETLVLSLQNPTRASVGSMDTFELTIEENDIPLTMADARELGGDEDAVVDGIVTRTESDGVYVQDDSGALFVFDDDVAAEVSVGDRILADGTTGFFSGLFQLGDVGTEGLRILSSGNPLPEAQTVTLGELSANGEAFESELVRVENFLIDSDGDPTFQGSTSYDIENPTGSLVLRIPGGSALVGTEIPTGATFEGVLGQFNVFGDPDEDFGYQLLGIESGDLTPQSITQETVLSVDFADDQLAPMTAVSVASNEDWGTSSAGGADNVPYAVINGFGGDEPANDWLISPALDFTALEDETLTFLNAKNFDDNGLERGLRVLVSTDYDGAGTPEDFTWTDVSDRVQNYSGGNYEFVSSGAVDLSDDAFQDGTVYVAFQYRSSGTGPGSTEVWEVDDIVVRGLQFN